METYNIGIYIIYFDGKDISWRTADFSIRGSIIGADQKEFEMFLGHLIRGKSPYTF